MFDKSSRNGRGTSIDRPEPGNEGQMADRSLELVKRAEQLNQIADALRDFETVASDEAKARWAMAQQADFAAHTLRMTAGRELVEFWSDPNNGVTHE